MMLLLVVWPIVGLAHWCDYMLHYANPPMPIDIVLGLPFFLLLGPISTIKKVLQ